MVITHVLFRASASTVARPVDVNPMMDNPSADQMKWSFQLS
jgi:hypothetical protein